MNLYLGRGGRIILPPSPQLSQNEPLKSPPILGLRLFRIIRANFPILSWRLTYFSLMNSRNLLKYYVDNYNELKLWKQTFQFVIFNLWKAPWDWVAFSFVMSPGLLYYLIRCDTGWLTNEAFVTNLFFYETIA